MGATEKDVSVFVGVECGTDYTYPVVTVFPNNETGDEKSKAWARHLPEQIHGVAHHVRIRRVKMISRELLSNNNNDLAKIIFN